MMASSQPDPISLAIDLHEQATELCDGNHLDEALSCCARSLESFVEVEGEDSGDVANILNTLASICDRRGEYREAANHAMRTVAILDRLGERFIGEEAAEIRIAALTLAGNAQRQSGQYAAASRCCARPSNRRSAVSVRAIRA
jgi:hypothetical protein